MGLIIQPLWLYIIGILAVLIIIIEILEKKLTIKKEVRKENKYLKKIKKIKNLPAKEKLNSINRLSRDFFSENGFSKSFEYSEISEKLYDKNLKREGDFCQQINKLLYSNKIPTKKDINSLIEEFTKIVSENRIASAAD